MKIHDPEENNKEEFAQVRKEIEEYEEHKAIADHQANMFVKAKEELKEGECVVVEDFAGRFLVKAVLQMSQEDYFARKEAPDLVLFAYYRNEKGEVVFKSFDILSKVAQKDDFAYLRSAWLHLLNQGDFFDRFHTIKIFSDGGPKHFKIRKSIFFFSHGIFFNRATVRVPATLMSDISRIASKELFENKRLLMMNGTF